jgi:hypothetical protein
MRRKGGDVKLTTVLQFADRSEGQVLHVGPADECERVASMLSAISYSGTDKVLASKLQIIPDDVPLVAGDRWMQRDGKLYTLHPNAAAPSPQEKP